MAGTQQILDRMAHGSATVHKAVAADIHHFPIPVKQEPQVWREFVASELGKRGMRQMESDCRGGKFLHEHAKILTFEILFSIGGYRCPELGTNPAISLFSEFQKNIHFFIDSAEKICIIKT